MSVRLLYIVAFGLNMFVLGRSTVAPNRLWPCTALAAVLSAFLLLSTKVASR